MTRAHTPAALSLALCAAPLLAGDAPTNMLANGSFEEPDLGGINFVYTDVPSWSQGDDGSVWLFNRPDPTPDEWPAAHEGVQYADIGNTAIAGWLQQSVAIQVSGVYTFSWWSSTASSIAGTGSTAPYVVSILDSNGSVVYEGGFGAAWDSPESPWTPDHVDLFLSADVYLVRFLPTNVPFTWDVLIDSVWLTSFVGACGPADLAPAFGLLDLADITIFVTGFVNQEPIADLNENGLHDLVDVNQFVAGFLAGCP